MAETIHVEVPRRGVGSDLTEALAEYGLRSELVEDDAAWSLRVSFSNDERERLLTAAINAIESYLSDRMLPLIVQRANGGCIVRPPSD